MLVPWVYVSNFIDTCFLIYVRYSVYILGLLFGFILRVIFRVIFRLFISSGVFVGFILGGLFWLDYIACTQRRRASPNSYRSSRFGFGFVGIYLQKGT